MFVYNRFALAIKNVLKIDLEIVHEFATEYEHSKQQFIIKEWPNVKSVHPDVTKLGDTEALCVISGFPKEVKSVRVGVGGFSCKDALVV
jgi:hypothetical protein